MVFKAVTRFAPTPSGGLHFGSLVAALASYLYCKSRQSGSEPGLWKLRFDDLDIFRNKSWAVSLICSQLESYGLLWDETPILQSQHVEEYRKAIIDLAAMGLLFFCTCSRAELDRYGAKRNEWGERIYHGKCRRMFADSEEVQKLLVSNVTLGRSKALRLLISDLHRVSEFFDGCQGLQKIDLVSEWGSPVLFRADGIVSYYVANVVDDWREKVTHVVRGSDLLGATHVHLFLHRAMYKVGAPDYIHVPVVKDTNGRKLSKSENSAVLSLDKNQIIFTLNRALIHLGQQEISDASTPEELVQQAVINFCGFAKTRIDRESGEQK